MNRRRLIGALAGLALGLCFYLAYRTDHTVSNRVLSWLCGATRYAQLKQEAARWLPVPALLRGSLPSALWCFIVMSLAGSWRVRVMGRAWTCAWLCPFMNASWEAVQALGWTDGRADMLDVLAGFVGAAIAHVAFSQVSERPRTPTRWTWQMSLTLMGIVSMAFADVWR